MAVKSHEKCCCSEGFVVVMHKLSHSFCFIFSFSMYIKNIHSPFNYSLWLWFWVEMVEDEPADLSSHISSHLNLYHGNFPIRGYLAREFSFITLTSSKCSCINCRKLRELWFGSDELRGQEQCFLCTSTIRGSCFHILIGTTESF